MNWFITALSPHWDTDMNFNISVPELCLIRFCVRDQLGLLSSDFICQYTLPFTSLKKGEPHKRKERQGGVGDGFWESDEELNYSRWHCVIIIVFPFSPSVSSTEGCSMVFGVFMKMLIYIIYFAAIQYIHFFFTSPFLPPPFRLPMGASPVPRWMQPGSSLPLRLCLVFLKTALCITLARTHTVRQQIEKRGWCSSNNNKDI